MHVLYPRCAALDMHKDTIVACVRCVSAPMHQKVRSFGSTTAGLLALADWLALHGCIQVAMEATRARVQDRRQRRNVDRRSARPWLDPIELRATSGHPGVAGN